MKTMTALLLSVLLSVMLFSLSGVAQQDSKLLPAEQAFRFHASLVNPNTIEAVWTIAEGYYMYRSKFGFTAEPVQAVLGNPKYPAGTIQHDEFFGETEIYTDSIRIALPLDRDHFIGGPLILLAAGQGCNKPVGVCYPPMTQRVRMDVPLTTSSLINERSGSVKTGWQSTSTGGSATELQKLLGTATGDVSEFLDPDDAFQVEIEIAGENALAVHFKIAPGYYLYRDKIAFQAVQGNAQVRAFDLPPGTVKQDPYFGAVEVYLTSRSVIVPIEKNALMADTLSLTVNYQGCAEKGICYAPMSTTQTIEFPSFVNAKAQGPAKGALSARNLIAIFGAAFVTGFLLTFTPCVLPLIPILSSIIVRQGGTSRRLRGGAISVAYVLGTAATYAAIGAVAGATGEQLQAYFQNIWAIGLISIILTLMALSMFGLYEIQMPAFVQSSLTARTTGLSTGSFGMIFLLGAVSALVVGACVSPLLISVLSIAIFHGDPYLGAGLMFSMALGMGVVLIAIGFGAGVLLPRAGAWMDRVKHLFGVMLIGVAIYLLGTIPAVPVLLLWAALLITFGIYLVKSQAPLLRWRYAWKGLGTISIIWGMLAIIGGLNGGRDILQPVSLALFSEEVLKDAVSEKDQPDFYTVTSVAELERLLSDARSDEQPVILDFYADWCTDCLRMEKTTFSNLQVRTVLNRFRLLKIDVTDPSDPVGKTIKQNYGVYGPPALLFFDAQGQEVSAKRLYGYLDPNRFLSLLKTLRI